MGIILITQFQCQKTVLFQTIPFSVSTHFSSIGTISRTLSVVTPPGQSGPGSNGNEGVLRTPQKLQHYWDSLSDCLVSYQDTHCLERKCIINSLLKHNSFVYSQLNNQTVLFQTILFSISHLFTLSSNVKQFYLTHK